MYRISKQKVTAMKADMTKRKSSMTLQQSTKYSLASKQCLPVVLFILTIVVANIIIESVSATDNNPPSTPMISFQSNFPSSVPISFGTTTEIPMRPLLGSNTSEIPIGIFDTDTPSTMLPTDTNNTIQTPSVTPTNTSSFIPTSVNNTTFPPTIINRPSTTISPISTNNTNNAPSITPTNTSSNIPTSIPSPFDNSTIIPTITDRPSTMPQQKETGFPVLSPVRIPSTTSIPSPPTVSLYPTTITQGPNIFSPSVKPIPSPLNVTPIALTTVPIVTPVIAPTTIPVSSPVNLNVQGTVPQASFTATSTPNASPTTAASIPNNPVSIQVTTSIPIALTQPTIQQSTEATNSTDKSFVPEVSTEDTPPFDSIKIEQQASKRSFWLIHSILLAVAWVIIMPSAVGVSLLQDMFPSVQLLYNVRKAATIFGILITTIGFGISVATIQQEGTNHFRSNTHSKVGLAVFVIAIVYTMYDLYMQEKKDTVYSSQPTTDKIVSIGKRTQVEEISDEEQEHGGDNFMDNTRTTIGGNNRVGQDIDMFETDSKASTASKTAEEVLYRILGLILIGIGWYTCYTGVRIYETRYDIDYSIVLWACMGGIIGAFIIVYTCSKI